jgi:hypothetical protein
MVVAHKLEKREVDSVGISVVLMIPAVAVLGDITINKRENNGRHNCL